MREGWFFLVLFLLLLFVFLETLLENDRPQLVVLNSLSDRSMEGHRREGSHSDLFWIERGWHPVCPTICVMFLASHQALLSGNSARRLMCAGGAAAYNANRAQQMGMVCHMTAPKGAQRGSVSPTSTNLLCSDVIHHKNKPAANFPKLPGLVCDVQQLTQAGSAMM